MDERRQLYVDGEFVDPDSGEWFDSVDPYRGEPVARVPRGNERDVDRAVEAARDAVFDGEWSSLAPTERGEYLFDLADALEDRTEEHATLEVRENGKPIREMSSQHGSIPDWYRFYGGLADKIGGAVIPAASADTLVYTRREPVGVVAAVTPWNSPLMLATWKLAPALAAGNAVVLKPDERASTSALAFASVVDEVGFPAGVVNVVTGYGDEVGGPLIEHEAVDKVSFTGGTATGARVAGAAGENLTPTAMELGGKSPNVVFPDADVDAAVDGALSAIFTAAGQSCSAGSRLLLHEDLHEEFVDRLVEGAAGITLGDPLDPATEMGPIASPDQFERVEGYVEVAIEDGASLVYGGEPPEEDLGSDLFFLPTILTDVDADDRIAQEEVFGPVLAVLTFGTEEEAVDIANDVPFGLAAGLWTGDVGRAHRVADRIRAGRVWINRYGGSSYAAPQGGFKQSGWGRENGVEGMEEFLATKTVWVDLSEG